MTAPHKKHANGIDQPKKHVQNKATEKRILDEKVQGAVEDGQKAYLSESAVVCFGLPPLAAALCSLERLRRLHYLHDIRLPRPRQKPGRGAAFEEVIDWIADRIPVQQEHLVKAHPKVVINYVERVLDAEFEKLEKGVVRPSLASKAALLGHHFSDDMDSAHMSALSLDDLRYSFPAPASGTAPIHVFHPARSPNGAMQQRPYEAPFNSPRPHINSMAQYERRDQEIWHRNHAASCLEDFTQAAPWSRASFDSPGTHGASPVFEMEGLSPEDPTPHGRGRSPLSHMISPRVHSVSPNDHGYHSAGFPGHREVAHGGNVAPFFELPKSRIHEHSRSPPMLLHRQQHWNQAGHL